MATISFTPQTLMLKLEQGQHDALAQDMLQILDHFEYEKTEQIDPRMLEGIELVAQTLLQILASDRFMIPLELAHLFINRNTVLANMLRLTRFGSGDAIIPQLVQQPMALPKLLTVYSPYCSLRLRLADLFQSQAYLASLWTAAILKGRWKGPENSWRFIQELMADPALSRYTLDDESFPLMEETYFAYFESTYAAPDKDRALRDIVNTGTKAEFKHDFTIGSNKKRILVISANMNIEHAIYRCLAPLLYALKPDYHLTLFHIHLNEESNLDRALFDEIKPLGVKDETDSFTYEMLEKILGGDYGIALFTDIGLNRPSIILSNLRLAPIQITTYGHPVTSGDSEIDYYIGGQAVEEKENPERHFAEQLVLIPGLGVEPVRLPYHPKFPKPQYEWCEIGLSWGEMKFAYPHLALLKQIQEQAGKKTRFHFIGINATRLTLAAVRRDLADFFGAEKIHVSPSMGNADYLQTIEACDLLLDSSPFGSYNRIVDGLACHKPVISLEGEKSYGRFASALLRQVGLPELVAATPEEFIAKSVKLIADDSWRNAVMEKIRSIDLDAQLFDTGNARYFKKAIDNIVAHHETRQDRSVSKAIIVPA